MKKNISVVFLLIITLILTSCGHEKGEQEGSEKKVSLTVSAAASLTDALTEVKDVYEKVNPNVKLTFNFASSGTLQHQIQQGAPVDIFISAAQNKMDPLQEKGLIIDESRENFFKNTVVLITSQEDLIVTQWQSLLGEDVEKIAIGDPESVPAGKYAQEVLTYLGIWDNLQPKLVLAKDVRQVLTYVETGNVDAGVVYMTDAKISSLIKIVDQAPDSSHSPVTYPVALIKNSKNVKASQDFLEYLSGEKGKEILQKYGFIVIK